MAIVKDNIILEGLSGMVGKTIVFRQFKGKTVVQMAPVRTAPFNEAQKKQQSRFSDAMAYARIRINDPKLKARYTSQAKAKGGSTNPYNMAIAEYFRLQKMKVLLTIKTQQQKIKALLPGGVMMQSGRRGAPYEHSAMEANCSTLGIARKLHWKLNASP